MGICAHRRHKRECEECGGASLCMHGQRKSRCKECGGAGLCVHGEQKSKCRECGGASICMHRQRKSYCKKCKECDGQWTWTAEEVVVYVEGGASPVTLSALPNK